MAWGPQFPESRQLVSDSSFFHRHPLIRRRGADGIVLDCVLFVCVILLLFFFNQRDIKTQFF